MSKQGVLVTVVGSVLSVVAIMGPGSADRPAAEALQVTINTPVINAGIVLSGNDDDPWH